MTKLHLPTVQGLMCIYVTKYPKYVTSRDPVVHKICIRKLNRYVYLVKNIAREKWSLEKSLSSLIRRVIQLPSAAEFFYFCC